MVLIGLVRRGISYSFSFNYCVFTNIIVVEMKEERGGAWLSVLLMCICAVNVAANWSPVWTDSYIGYPMAAALDPSFPDLAVVYSDTFTVMNVTTGKVLWNNDSCYLLFTAVRRGVVYVITAVTEDEIYLYAFDGRSGQLVWTGPQCDTSSFVVAPQGTEFLILVTEDTIFGVNGSSVWSGPSTRLQNNSSTIPPSRVWWRCSLTHYTVRSKLEQRTKSLECQCRWPHHGGHPVQGD